MLQEYHSIHIHVYIAHAHNTATHVIETHSVECYRAFRADTSITFTVSITVLISTVSTQPLGVNTWHDSPLSTLQGNPLINEVPVLGFQRLRSTHRTVSVPFLGVLLLTYEYSKTSISGPFIAWTAPLERTVPLPGSNFPLHQYI